MTIYTVTGHIIGQPPQLDYVQPEALRAALQVQGVGTTVSLTLAAQDDTGHKNHGALR